MTDVANIDGLLDIEGWDKLEPIETKRMELVDGVVIVTPRPAVFPHVMAMAHMIRIFGAADVLALPEPEVVISAGNPATVRVPDLVVMAPDTEPADAARLQASEVLLVVEIVSPGSRRTDYIAKRYDYEQARIPYFWIVDPAERRVTCLKLTEGAYQELPVPSGSSIVFPEPVRITSTWERLLGH